MIQLRVNGEARSLDRSMSVSEFLAERGLQERMVVVEHNGEILARERYGDVFLQPSDNLEIVQMMAGG